VGFDFTAGRIDSSAHPFCTSFATTDVRLTTRINEYDLRSCLFGLIHEAGHGLYEQGMRADFNGTFAREGASMGIHESQSLFWEAIIARSEEFWHWALPLLRRYFPSQLGEVTPRQMYQAINAVEPSLIRIEADEVTYNMHIILRYEIEKQLLEGSLSVDEIPSYWNDRFHQLLGLEVPDDARGCLQDIHWSFGGFGYFPSYTLGKLYAAMFRRSLLETIPETPQLVRNGDFAPIHQWLRSNIHQWGRTMKPSELVTKVTGSTLKVDDFIEYARRKVQRIYGNA
jgi:carboxypeptidase Taq